MFCAVLWFLVGAFRFIYTLAFAFASLELELDLKANEQVKWWSGFESHCI